MKKSILNFTFIVLLIFFNSSAFAQQKGANGLLGGLPEGLSINGYVDAYISYDNDKGNLLRQFSAIAPFRDEFRLNLVMASLRYEAKKIRGNLALQFGDIPKVNWPQAPNEYLQYIQEGNIGISPGKNYWLDAGYFLTHIGGESIIPQYNFFESLSLCTHYEPFYQSGLKFSYTGKKFYGAVMILNGFNVFADNNKNKSFGLQLGYIPNKKMDITYNNVTGNEMPAGTPGRTRIYNNLVVKIYPAKKLDVILCGDFCTQEQSKITDSSASASMFSGFLSLRYRVAKKISVSARAEIFQDKDGILSGIFTGSNSSLTGLKASGFSLGVEYAPTDNAYFRIEGRYLTTDSNQKIFFESKDSRVEAILSGGIEF
jgi:hypothetical protein